MDSIKQQQPEKNYQDLQGAAAIARLRTMIEEVPNCFFCTRPDMTQKFEPRPMNVRKVDETGTLWFLSSADSTKNDELASDAEVELFFQGSKHACFLHLRGHATVMRDRDIIEVLWSPLLNTWFTGGKDDPRITVIKVVPTEGHYWDHKHGEFVAGAKMWLGAALGRTLDDTIEGRLKPH